MTSALRGGGGVPSKADIVSNLSKGGCMNLPTGGRGKKIRNFFGRHIWKPPNGMARFLKRFRPERRLLVLLSRKCLSRNLEFDVPRNGRKSEEGGEERRRNFCASRLRS